MSMMDHTSFYLPFYTYFAKFRGVTFVNIWAGMNFNVTLSLNFANFKKISIHKKTSLSKYKSSYLTLRLLYPRHNTFLAESDN